MKKHEKVILIVLIGLIGVFLIGLAIKDSTVHQHDLPSQSQIASYKLKDVKQLTLQAVPIHDKKYGNLKPHFMNVYTEEHGKLTDITKYGHYQSSDKKHQFGNWEPRVNQRYLHKIIHQQPVYFKVTYGHGVKKWYKIDNLKM